MKRQHYRSDLTLNVKITRPANSDGGGGQVAIPEHVRLEYFVPDGRTSIVAERNGKDTTLCKLSEDGMSLEVFLPLSRRQLGVGNLIVVITEYSPAAGFPDEIKEIHNPSETGIQLWRGASDGDGTITTEAELVAWRYGYSAYELAKIHGFEGTEEEFITWLRQPAVDASSEAAKAELERSQAETRRVSAERGRVSAEEVRSKAEESRVKAESSRGTAEDSRVNAEQERVDKFGLLKLASQQATQAANDAASKANTQAAAAEKAASIKVVIDVATGIVSILKGEEKEDIGRIPEARGEYVEGQTYYNDNIVTRYGSAFQCVVESTTTPPATLDASGSVALGEGWIFFTDASATHMFEGLLDRLTTLLGYCEKRTVVNLELGVSGKYVQCESRSAVANAAFAISKPFDVDACSELLIKTGFNPSDASHKGLDLSVIAIYEQIERQRTVQKKNPDGQLLYYVVTTDAETGNQTVTQDETTEDTGYPVYAVETYTETRYLPNNEDRFVAIPDSGYYVANIPQSCKVVISYKPGISDTAVIVEKHGAIANLISQVFGIYEHRTMVECMVSLEERIKAIEQSRGLLGNATAGTLDVSEPTKCNYPMTLFGHGVPAEATKPTNLPEGLPWDGCPMFKGQMYINLDAASGGLYYAVSVDSVNGWRQA